MSAFWRKLVLALHVVTSVGLIGVVAGFLALAIVGATTNEPQALQAAYLGMQILTWPLIVPLAAASLIVGIAQSLGTPWGLFRYYWLIVKLALTILAVVVLMLQTATIDALADAATTGSIVDLQGARIGMILHSTGGLVVLLLATLLSVYKPRGLTRYGAKALNETRLAI